MEPAQHVLGAAGQTGHRQEGKWREKQVVLGASHAERRRLPQILPLVSFDLFISLLKYMFEKFHVT